jgi:hypothetical protein
MIAKQDALRCRNFQGNRQTDAYGLTAAIIAHTGRSRLRTGVGAPAAAGERAAFRVSGKRNSLVSAATWSRLRDQGGATIGSFRRTQK